MPSGNTEAIGASQPQATARDSFASARNGKLLILALGLGLLAVCGAWTWTYRQLQNSESTQAAQTTVIEEANRVKTDAGGQLKTVAIAFVQLKKYDDARKILKPLSVLLPDDAEIAAQLRATEEAIAKQGKEENLSLDQKFDDGEKITVHLTGVRKTIETPDEGKRLGYTLGPNDVWLVFSARLDRKDENASISPIVSWNGYAKVKTTANFSVAPIFATIERGGNNISFLGYGESREMSIYFKVPLAEFPVTITFPNGKKLKNVFEPKT